MGLVHLTEGQTNKIQIDEGIVVLNLGETDEEILEYLACCDSHCYYQTIYKDNEVIYTLHCIDPLV